MRINLVTPYSEKDAAKALGARWDATKRIWYIVDVDDLTPFLRWIPDGQAAQEGATAVAPAQATPKEAKPVRRSAGVITTSIANVPHCGCNVPPWQDCIHTSTV